MTKYKEVEKYWCCQDCGNIMIAVSEPTKCNECKSKKVEIGLEPSLRLTKEKR